MDKFSLLGSTHSQLIEEYYNRYLKTPSLVDEDWRNFFRGFDFAKTSYHTSDEVPETFKKEFKVINLINGYRSRGHLFTKTNPVRERRKYNPSLAIENFDLEESDLNLTFQAGNIVGLGPTTLNKIINHLKAVYCDSIGVEYMYIRKPEEVDWIKKRLHINNNSPNLNSEEKKRILHKLNEAVVFENFLHTKYVGQKRFSIEGAESIIPALDAVIQKGANLGVQEFVLGMAHRGRLNVLANIFGKTYKDIFAEFEGKDFEEVLSDGDVKYHVGFTAKSKTKNGQKVKLNLSPNPSHLEAVNPVVQGISRAKIDRKYNGNASKLLPILIHGDAAIAGQGVIYEVIQMAQLEGYKTGGTIHLVINNQIGFTTNYLDGRSSTYCTDISKVTLCPVFHVNGDDVEALIHAINMAIEYRQKFNKDVFIDILCYRKYGHNEGDEPRFTQPLLYKTISSHPNPRAIYTKQLLKEGIIKKSIADKMEKDFKKMLEEKLNEAKNKEKTSITPFVAGGWKGIKRASSNTLLSPVDTSCSMGVLKNIAKKIYTPNKSVPFFSKINRLLSERRKMIETTDKIDWGMAELLAYSSLLKEGFNVRISGQDSERGTFSHRHAILKVEDSEEEVCLLKNINPDARFEIYNSLLSEYAVLGFEYGFAMASPHALTVWEAQFGDFVNGAQIILDQFISSAEDKWKTKNGLVLLLPHGYEGQGSEHSSARIERFLQSCAEDNMIIANCTTPANFYHLLRRQLHAPFRKPLVVFTPKKLLRYSECTSSIKELSSGFFKPVIIDKTNPKKCKKLVFCSGKIYYDLLSERVKLKNKNIVLVRIEQLYPFPKKDVLEIIDKYKADSVYWVQEEPKNMGPWGFILLNLQETKISLISRKASASTATGSMSRDLKRQQTIINKVFE